MIIIIGWKGDGGGGREARGTGGHSFKIDRCFVVSSDSILL